jgi:hypothetical protein
MRGGITMPWKLFPRYRRPSWKTLVGLTQAQRNLKRESGYYALTKPLRIPYNLHRTLLRKVGWYSGIATFARWLFKRH